MVLNNTNKNNSILLDVLALVFTVSSYVPDNPRIYWMQQMLRNPNKYRFISDSLKCYIKHLSRLLKVIYILVLSKVFISILKYRGMWILENFKTLLEHLKSSNFNQVTSTKFFRLSPLYTTIPHQKLKDRLSSISITHKFSKTGTVRHKHLVWGNEEAYFVKAHLILSQASKNIWKVL